MSVNIKGFTQQQGKLADMIWSATSMEEVAAIVEQNGVDAIVARDMIIAGLLDQENDTDIAVNILAEFML